MAFNAASHNAAGAKTGPVSGPPPPASTEIKAAIAGANAQDPLGQHEGGKDGGDKAAGQKVKTEKELEKERKKAEKLEKFKAKQAKSSTEAPPVASKNKEKKQTKEAKEDTLPPYIEETPPGEKKILKPLEDEYHKAYNPKVVESAWYEWWEKEGFFKPQFAPDGKPKPAGVFSIPCPPPNVTGMLHMGHAINLGIMDTLIRWNRMLGKTTLFLPGVDHAGIATQLVVEKMLQRTKQVSRHDLGRERFLQEVWKWKDDYHRRITGQFRRIGSSLDWSREAFTMDANLSAAVTKTFCQLHDEGLIYRAKRLVNWCSQLNTAISNLEVENKELSGRTLLDVPGYERKVEFGVLTHFRYPLEDAEGTIEVATTRPETMLGDTGVAVNPSDDRYKHLVGKKVKHPFLDRLLPIFADEYVDPEFGTGAVKITPAHDHNDFNLGEKHNLPFINIINEDGTLNSNAGTSFQGMKRFDARYEVIKQLKDKGLWVKQVDNPMTVPICVRSKDVIEPLIKPQWFMRMREMGEAAAKAVRSGEIKIRPETNERNFLRWMDGLQDWCLSRQLWWGHQVCAYRIDLDGQTSDSSDGSKWVAAPSEKVAEEKARTKFPGRSFTLKRDEDVLDTWFSSQLWPFSTLGWPNETRDLETFFPQSVLETGHDILNIWVARMIMISLRIMKQRPFKEVYCHPLVRDSEGRKMSKSLGNVIDPIAVMDGITLDDLQSTLTKGNLDPKELVTATKYQKSAFPNGIPECGADALRFSLVNYTTGGENVNFDVKVIHANRRFCNKIYQATKYVLGKLDKDFVPNAHVTKTGKETLAERWILAKFNSAALKINEALEARDFQQATVLAYNYFYAELCDSFVENSKAIIAEGHEEARVSATNTLYTVLEGGLKLLHPLMPFITEELWQRLPRRPNDETRSIMLASYPVYNKALDDPASEEAYELVLDVSKAIRSLMGEYQIKEDVVLYVQLFDQRAYDTCTAQLQSIRSLSGKGVSQITLLGSGDAKPAGCVPQPISASATVLLRVKGRVDLDQEIGKARKKMEKASEVVKRHRSLLQDKAYKSQANAETQEADRRKLADAEKEVEEMQDAMQRFEALKLE